MGYRLFRCRPCRRTVNERTGTPFNHLQVPTASALLVVRWRRRYQRSLRERAALVLTRGFTFTHETVREGEGRCAPLRTACLRARRRGKAGLEWPADEAYSADETYVKVDGRWRYLYRASAAAGPLVASMLSATRARDAAPRFFTRARTVVGHAPAPVTTDGHDASPRALRATRGAAVQHRTSRSMHNPMEQDQRGIQQRPYPLRGVGACASAARCCAAHDERRDRVR